MRHGTTVKFVNAKKKTLAHAAHTRYGQRDKVYGKTTSTAATQHMDIGFEY